MGITISALYSVQILWIDFTLKLWHNFKQFPSRVTKTNKKARSSTVTFIFDDPQLAPEVYPTNNGQIQIKLDLERRKVYYSDGGRWGAPLTLAFAILIYPAFDAENYSLQRSAGLALRCTAWVSASAKSR
jgi:hypothetical protein